MRALTFLVLAGWAISGPALAAEEAELAGKDACLMCHEPSAGFLSSVHASKECEDCHGPGSLHVDAGGDASLIRTPNAPDWSTACLSCHVKGERNIGRFAASPHGQNKVACIDCHRIHPEKATFGLVKASDPSLCVSCHSSVEAAFRKPFHHPVLEGGMKCTDCHNPHSDKTESMRRLEIVSSNGCASCHADKKGPFIFSHAAVETGGCLSCHQNHGSFNSKMLVRSDVFQLCLECHTFVPGVASSQPPSFHDIRSPRYRNCTTCHREIHGSNVNPLFLR